MEWTDQRKAAGIAVDQAEAMVRAAGTAQAELATKAVLTQTLAPIRIDPPRPRSSLRR